MEKTRISLTIDPEILATIDTEARASGLSRSAWLERVSQQAAIRSQFERFDPPGGVEEFPVEMREHVSAVRVYWDSDEAR